jgi:hypothetical protein
MNTNRHQFEEFFTKDNEGNKDSGLEISTSFSLLPSVQEAFVFIRVDSWLAGFVRFFERCEPDQSNHEIRLRTPLRA